jgi:hypothetical protein
MEYQTVSSREIVIPELAVTLHIHSVELPGSMSDAADGRHSQELDALLVAACQEIFRVGPNEIISFSEWSRAGERVLTALDSFRPAPPCRSVLCGRSEQRCGGNTAVSKPRRLSRAPYNEWPLGPKTEG